jgi:hypothetical protein
VFDEDLKEVASNESVATPGMKGKRLRDAMEEFYL